MTRDDRIEELADQAFDLTLRDYFAAKAMQAMLPNNYDVVAKHAYKMADAMLEARGEK